MFANHWDVDTACNSQLVASGHNSINVFGMLEKGNQKTQKFLLSGAVTGASVTGTSLGWHASRTLFCMSWCHQHRTHCCMYIFQPVVDDSDHVQMLINDMFTV